MVRGFENATISVYNLVKTDKNGSQVVEKESVYTNIPCAFWKKTENRQVSELNNSSDFNKYIIDLDSSYSLIAIGQLVVLNSKNYEVADVIPHPDFDGTIDNYEIIIKAYTNVDNI